MSQPHSHHTINNESIFTASYHVPTLTWLSCVSNILPNVQKKERTYTLHVYYLYVVQYAL